MSVLSHLFGNDVRTVPYCFYNHNLHSCSIKITWFEYVIVEVQLPILF